MPYFLSDFLNQNPGVELIMDVTNKNKVVESVELNEVDFALVSIMPNIYGIQKLDLLKNKLFMVGNTNFNSVNNQIINEKNLSPLIYREKGSGTRQMMERFLSQRHITVQKMLEHYNCLRWYLATLMLVILCSTKYIYISTAYVNA
jgi:DNA-binding transcriptional LysR family regulator